MSTLDWTVFGLASVIVLLLGAFRRRPPTAQEIAKEVVVASNEAAMTMKRAETKECERCRRTVPLWFAESLPPADFFCFSCSEGKPYPHPEQTEDDYVAEWLEAKEERRKVDLAAAEARQPEHRGIVEEPPGDDT
jgi:hypothetical protein